MIKYIINAQYTLVDGTILRTEDFVVTGEVAKDDHQIIGDNGITEGPMSEFEANERIIELIEEFPETKFEIKEVK